jgi:hypothetical protein
MKAIKVLAAIILLLSVTSLSVRAQCPYAAAAAAAAAASSSGSSSQPGQFRTITVSGSEGSFVPSTFHNFDNAVALGSAAPGSSHSTFMAYDQALKQANAELAAKSRSLGDVARELHKNRQPQAQQQGKSAASTALVASAASKAPGSTTSASTARASTAPTPLRNKPESAQNARPASSTASKAPASTTRKKTETAQDIVNRILPQ